MIFRVAPQGIGMTLRLTGPESHIFCMTFRILTGPGFCMRFILQNPGWVWGKWGPLWLLSGWVICGSYVGQIQANVPVDSAGHMPQPQFY